MEWPYEDATASGKESKGVNDDEQLSVNEAGDFIGGNEPLSVLRFGEAVADCENSSRSKPVPIMLLVLPIIPFRISHNFYQLFLFYSHAITYYSCKFL